MHKNSQNMAILVTGVAGFIGFHTAKKLVEMGEKVVGVDNLSEYYDVKLKLDRLNELGDSIEFIKGDISDYKFMEQIFDNHKITSIVHLAAQAGVRYSLENPFEYEKTNNLGTMNLFELAKLNNIKNVVYASSSSVYGGNTHFPFSVKDRVDNPISVYAATKKYNELLAESYSKLYGINMTGLRFFTVYGPWGRPDMFMYKLLDAINEGKSVDIYNNGDHIRDFTFVDDIVSGIISSHKNNTNGSKIYNLGNNKPVELMKVVEIIENNMNKSATKNYLPMQKGDVYKTYADISETISELNWKPTTTIEEGISKFVDWYKKYKK